MYGVIDALLEPLWPRQRNTLPPLSPQGITAYTHCYLKSPSRQNKAESVFYHLLRYTSPLSPHLYGISIYFHFSIRDLFMIDYFDFSSASLTIFSLRFEQD
jgi:hypothetical protein